MNLAPAPQEQVNFVRWQLAHVDGPTSEWVWPMRAWACSPTLESLAIVYNAFADVPAFGLPHIDHFSNEVAAKAALERLLAQLLVLHEGKAA